MDSRTYSRRVEEFLEKMRNGQPVSSKSSKSWTIPLILFTWFYTNIFLCHSQQLLVLSITLQRGYQAIHIMVCGVMLLNFVFFDQACHFWLIMIKFWMRNMSFYSGSYHCYVDVDVDLTPKFLVPQMHDLNCMWYILMSHQS